MRNARRTNLHTTLGSFLDLPPNGQLSMFRHVMIIVDKYNKVSAPNLADNLIDSGSFKYAFSGPFMLVASRSLTLYLGFCNHNARGRFGFS